VYAPVLLGGYSLTRGGVGNVLAALLGLIILSLVGNILDLGNASFFWQQVVTGVVLIAAVYADGRRRGETFR
jgi:ribose/xylose/arabinose/galactoside ABC-type transport system permease subunit